MTGIAPRAVLLSPPVTRAPLEYSDESAPLGLEEFLPPPQALPNWRARGHSETDEAAIESSQKGTFNKFYEYIYSTTLLSFENLP